MAGVLLGALAKLEALADEIESWGEDATGSLAALRIRTALQEVREDWVAAALDPLEDLHIRSLVAALVLTAARSGVNQPVKVRVPGRLLVDVDPMGLSITRFPPGRDVDGEVHFGYRPRSE